MYIPLYASVLLIHVHEYTLYISHEKSHTAYNVHVCTLCIIYVYTRTLIHVYHYTYYNYIVKVMQENSLRLYTTCTTFIYIIHNVL